MIFFELTQLLFLLEDLTGSGVVEARCLDVGSHVVGKVEGGWLGV